MNVKGIVLMGDENASSEKIIEKLSGLDISRVPYGDLNEKFIEEQARKLKENGMKSLRELDKNMYGTF